MRQLIYLFGFTLLMTGCMYRMPTDDDPNVIPTTNNPHVIKQAQTSWVPGVAY